MATTTGTVGTRTAHVGPRGAGRRTRTRRLVVAVGLLAAVCAGLAPAPAGILPAGAAAAPAPACEPDPVTCPSRLYLGASAPGLPGSTADLDAFGAAVGHQPNLVLWFQSFAGDLDVAGMRAAVDRGQLPVVTWEPGSTDRAADPYPLRAIAEGDLDGYLRRQAEAVAAIGAPVGIRFGHEMNGDWYAWGQGVNGNGPQEYLDAYRHVHDLFTEAGATEVVWVWSPNPIDFDPTQDLATLYPGDAYVDWVGLSVYLDDVDDTFEALVGPTLAQLDRIAPTTPIFVAETSVLRGPARPAMIGALLDGLLATPRLVGFSWFEHDARLDWRLSDDPAGAARLAEALDAGWFATPSPPGAPVEPPQPLAPRNLAPPTIAGAAHAGITMAATNGTWHPDPASGALGLSGRWYRCTDRATVASCTSTAGTNRWFASTQWDLGRAFRYRVAATNLGGETVVWSAPTATTLMTPARPDPPAVEARDGALRVTFPSRPPFGTTHWQLAVDGRAIRPDIPVTSTVQWVTGLENGRSYGLSLRAISASPTESLPSPATEGTVVPLRAPWAPHVKVGDTTATFTLPTTPTGTDHWVLTLDGTPRTLPAGTTTHVLTDATPGPLHTWTLAAAAGHWDGLPHGAATPTTTGTFRLLAPAPGVGPAMPPPPVVEARDGALKVTFPTPPAGTVGWRLALDGVARPTIPVTATVQWLTGLENGRPYALALQAVGTADGVPATSAPTEGTVVPLRAPWAPHVKVGDTTATFTLPTTPTGTDHWVLTLDGTPRTLPAGTTTHVLTDATPGPLHTWTLAAAAGHWDGQPHGAATPTTTGTFRLPGG